MTFHTLVGVELDAMIQVAATHLTNNASKIDALNVFPVPDGDTGTNMNLSMTSGAKEARLVQENHVGLVATAFAKGLLMGARGNSGVILSQLFRGFAKSIEEKEQISTQDFAEALDQGVQTAYKAVTEPVEGTILTVGRETAQVALQLAKNHADFVSFMEEVVQAAKKSLSRTPDLLPVLKEVGVVDSGGQGLVVVYEGFLAKLKGEVLPESSLIQVDSNEQFENVHHKHAQDFLNTEDIKYGYCTEFMVKFEQDKLVKRPYSEDAFRAELGKRGDSLLVVSDDDVVKVHIHTEYPGDAMTLGQTYGSLINIKVENMREQHSAIVGNHKAERTPYAIISVCAGKGVSHLFKSLGASTIIEGGQTMNPSTEDIQKKIAETNADHIIILPNNKNIIMSAEQARDLTNEKDVTVIPSKSIPQGMNALIHFDPEAASTINIEKMIRALQEVKSAQVTYAVRDTSVNGLEIHKNEFIGLTEGKIIQASDDRLDVTKRLIREIVADDDEIITILYGEDVTAEEADVLVAYIEETFSDIEVELHEGNQPVYAYIIAVE